jgi:hypothetical protein
MWGTWNGPGNCQAEDPAMNCKKPSAFLPEDAGHAKATRPASEEVEVHRVSDLLSRIRQSHCGSIARRSATAYNSGHPPPTFWARASIIESFFLWELNSGGPFPGKSGEGG